MNPLLLSLLPGAITGLGLALLLLILAPRTLRAGDALNRLGEVTVTTGAPSKPVGGFERVGAWLHQHSPNLPGFTAPIKSLDLLEISVSRFYADKLQLAAIGFVVPLFVPVLFQLLLGIFFPLPLILSPIIAIIMWTVPDSSVRAKTKEAQREFTKFVTVYLQLVAVALLGNTTADSALSSAASISDTWVFRRIRREYQAADLTRTSKWDALERLGDFVDVPALTDMARTMRLSEARVGLRDQLIAACDILRAQVAADDKAAAERITSRMDIPVFLTLIPILAITVAPSLFQITNL